MAASVEPGAAGGSIKRRFFSWEQIHTTVASSVDVINETFSPTLLVGISGGGLIPARLLRSGFKLRSGRTIPIQVVGAVHYDDDAGRVLERVERTQWLSPDLDLSGARLLLVDEVDDSRKTLAFIVEEFLKYFKEAQALHEAAGKGPWVQPQLGVYVIHNKMRPKEASIHSAVFPDNYWVGQTVPNMWNVYPWDAEDIIAHTAVAHAQLHYFTEKPGELELALSACTGLTPAEARSALQHYADGGSTRAPQLEALLLHPTTRPKSALSAALAEGGAPGTRTPPESAPQGIPKVSSGVWRSEPDGMYYNLGPVPKGLVPRFGSLTLVDYGTLSAREADEATQGPAQATQGR